MLKLTLLIIATLVPALYAANFCKSTKEFCERSWLDFDAGPWKHVDCFNPNSKIPTTCTNAQLIDLYPISGNILKKHNVARNGVAGGPLRATRMGTLRWNAYLTAAARKTVRNCKVKQIYCPKTPTFHWAGENIDSTTYPKTENRSSTAVVLQMIDNWMASKCPIEDIKQFAWKNVTSTKLYYKERKFCQVIRGYASRMGCSAIRYESGANYVLMLSCMYDSSPSYDWWVYDFPGDDWLVPGVCKTGKNKNYPNLCSTDEKFDVNNYTKDSFPFE